MSVQSGPNIITDGLVLYLDGANPKSYPGTGSVWYDQTKNNNDATLDTVTYSTDYTGNFLFNGQANESLVEATPIEPQYFTLCSWFQTTGTPSTNDSSGATLIVSSVQLFDGKVQYFLSHSYLNERIVVVVQKSTPVATSSDGSIINNKIHNVVCTYDGSRVEIYLNGEWITGSNYSTDPIYPTTGNRNVRIGNWGYSGFHRVLNGNIYNTSIYDRALSALEVRQNYDALKYRYILPLTIKDNPNFAKLKEIIERATSGVILMRVRQVDLPEEFLDGTPTDYSMVE